MIMRAYKHTSLHTEQLNYQFSSCSSVLHCMEKMSLKCRLLCCRHTDAAEKLASALFQGMQMPDSGEELLGAATTGLGVAAMLKRVLLKADVDPAAGTLTIRPEEAVKWLRLTRYQPDVSRHSDQPLQRPHADCFMTQNGILQLEKYFGDGRQHLFMFMLSSSSCSANNAARLQFDAYAASCIRLECCPAHWLMHCSISAVPDSL